MLLINSRPQPDCSVNAVFFSTARQPGYSLRGRRLKGKGKQVLGAKNPKNPRVSVAPKTPFPFPFKCLGKYLTRANIQKNLARELLRKVGICTCSCSILYPRFQFILFSVFECCTELRVETVA